MTRPLLLICLGYLAITLAYGVANPLFEAPDEHHHYFTAQFIAENDRLPSMADSDRFIKQEAAQPPLYYWLGSWLIRPIDTTTARDDLWFNPHVRLGDANSPANRNHFVHPLADWHGYQLAVHILRGFSTLFGLGTLLCIFHAVQRLTTHNAALLSTALVAFLPQFNFLHSYVNNDVAIIFFASLVTYQLIRLWITSNSRWITFLLLGLSIGLAMLSKTTGILLLAYSLGFLSILAIVRGWKWAKWLCEITLTGVGALGVAGWLLWRNWQLYGDITAANQFIIAAGGDRGVTLWQVLRETAGLWRSLIGVFGWFNIIAPTWVYIIWISLILIVLVGTVYSFPRSLFSDLRWECLLGRSASKPPSEQRDAERPRRHSDGDRRNELKGGFGKSNSRNTTHRLLLPLLLGWLLTVYAGMVLFMLQTTAAQGRLLLPAILPVAVLAGYGIRHWQQKFGRSFLSLGGALALTSLYCLFFVIRPVYALPETVAELPTDVPQIGVQLRDNIELVGAKLRTTEAQAGDNVWVDLYWRADALPDQPPEIVLELFGYNGAQSGRTQAYHGGGLYPATLWPVGEIVYTTVGATLENELNAPTQVRVNVRIVDGESVDLGHIKIPSPELDVLEREPLAQIGDGIELISADFTPKIAHIGDTITVSVTWRVIAPPNQMLTTFVHLGSAELPPLAQGDNQPRNGNYPTHLWESGEQFSDSYQFTLSETVPTGNFPVRIGMYDATITPLPLKIDEKFPADRSFTIGALTVDN